MTGDLAVANGKVRIAGRVKGNTVSIADRMVLGPRARVGGDVLYADKKPTLASGASVGGKVKRVDAGKATGEIGLAATIGIWIAVTISGLLLGFLLLGLFPRAAATVYDTAQRRVGAAFGFGLLAFIVIPIVAVVLLITVVGLPLGFLLLLAIAPIYAIAYIAASYAVGQRILGPERSRFLAFLTGFAILRVVALIPFLGGLVGFLTTVFGLGLLLLAAGRGRRAPGAAEPAPAAA